MHAILTLRFRSNVNAWTQRLAFATHPTAIEYMYDVIKTMPTDPKLCGALIGILVTRITAHMLQQSRSQSVKILLPDKHFATQESAEPKHIPTNITQLFQQLTIRCPTVFFKKNRKPTTSETVHKHSCKHKQRTRQPSSTNASPHAFASASAVVPPTSGPRSRYDGVRATANF